MPGSPALRLLKQSRVFWPLHSTRSAHTQLVHYRPIGSGPQGHGLAGTGVKSPGDQFPLALSCPVNCLLKGDSRSLSAQEATCCHTLKNKRVLLARSLGRGLLASPSTAQPQHCCAAPGLHTAVSGSPGSLCSPALSSGTGRQTKAKRTHADCPREKQQQ